MMSMVNAAQNPQAMLNQLAQSNPQLKQVMDIVSQYGGDADKAFMEIAKQKGINPQDILNMFK